MFNYIMILNAYAALDLFVTLLRLGLGVILLVVGGAVLWKACRSVSFEDRSGLEDRLYLLTLLAVVLLGLNIISWPLFYLLLKSYVPEWPGVMCIYGVTQIGKDSEGMSRFLPGLIQFLQIVKPVLVFISGAWLVLYLINRRTTTGPLFGRVVCALVVAGVLVELDAFAEAAYLVIPKKEELPPGGCCTGVFGEMFQEKRWLPVALVGENAKSLLRALFFLVNGGLALGLLGNMLRLRLGNANPSFHHLFLGAILAVPINAFFLSEVAAPVLMRLPYHHCPYDLIDQAPEALPAVALFFLGTFCVGWAWMATHGADHAETRPFLREYLSGILGLGLFGYLGCLVMIAVELALTKP